MAAPELPVLALDDAAAWAAWLAEHHATSPGVWLRLPKKTPAFTYALALDAALCWGWIDSQKRALDDAAFLQRFTRRNAKSPWSKINCAKIEVLVAAGKMQPPGLREVARAKEDGRWERAYHGAKTIEVPPDFVAALAADPAAEAFFAALDGANRYAILYRISSVKKPETRAANIAKFVALCARGERIHPVAAPRVGQLESTGASRSTRKPGPSSSA